MVGICGGADCISLPCASRRRGCEASRGRASDIYCRDEGRRPLKVILALVVLGLVAYGCERDIGAPARSAPVPTVPASSASAAASVAVPTTTAAPGAPSLAGWYPAGFAVSPLDPTVAYRWMSKNQFRCDPAPRCWGLQVLAKDGCVSDLTIELSLADGAGASLGTVFDTAGVVRAGQQATMVFEVDMSGAQKAEITKVSCT